MKDFYLYAEYAYLITACISVLVLAFCSSEKNKERHPIWAVLLCLICAVICHGMQKISIATGLHIYFSLAFMATSILCIVLMIFNIGGKTGYKNIVAFLLSFCTALLLWSIA
ncbi:MAG: hypothetical protein J6K72_10155 [Clostridia bacterium]|nr:hypothetical protein [Clostridia bacterium]